MLREVIFDTETTGLDPLKGDRLVELGCVEVIDYVPTGKNFHAYLNPERAVHKDAERIHGLSDKFLKDKPLFKDVVDDFLAFVGDSQLVAHNANFDMGFINAELSRLSRPPIPASRVIDTLPLARKKFPNQSNTLDALCARFNIDLSDRTKHGALLDSELLAAVYLELKGGKQKTLGLEAEMPKAKIIVSHPNPEIAAALTANRILLQISKEESAAHEALVKGIGDKALWLK
jgi:DNA polymerase III subunit epsilon